MTAPDIIDLAPDQNEVSNQGYTNACGPHAVANLWEVLTARAGDRQRLDIDKLWAAGRRLAGTGTDGGVSGWALQAACASPGLEVPGKPAASVQLVSTRAGLDPLASYERLLTMGIPLLVLLKVRTGWQQSISGPWTQHIINLDGDWNGDEHWVTVLGRKRSTGQWLVENSWGPSWGDGGYFGVQSSALTDPRFVSQVWHIDRCPVPFVHVAGFDMSVFFLGLNESVEFVQRSKPALKALLDSALVKGGLQGFIDECVRLQISDKHAEFLYDRTRYTVKQFHDSNPALNWAGFIWDQA